MVASFLLILRKSATRSTSLEAISGQLQPIKSSFVKTKLFFLNKLSNNSSQDGVSSSDKSSTAFEKPAPTKRQICPLSAAVDIA